tara:strand:- start:214 stop:609 length:396 start_codon:yes stop_codon:yes gene_type:complete
MKEKIFSKVETYLGEEIDPSLFYIQGFLNENVDYSLAEKRIFHELESLSSFLISEEELNRVQKKNESALRFSALNNSYKAVDLAIGTLLGNPNLINEDFSMFKSISRKDILIEAKKIFTKTNCTSLYYGKM